MGKGCGLLGHPGPPLLLSHFHKVPDPPSGRAARGALGVEGSKE